MPKTINPIRKRIVKGELRKGKSISSALKTGGYKPGTVRGNNNATTNKLVRTCIEEIKVEFKKEDITVEQILREWELIQKIALKIGDNRLYKDISDSKAKWLDMLSNGVTTQVNVYSQTPEDKKSLADIKNRIHTIPDKVETIVNEDDKQQ